MPADLTQMALRCARCQRRHPLADLAWRCASCAGVLDLSGFSPTLPTLSALGHRAATLWRYAEALPVGEPVGITMGEGLTPLVTAPGHRGIGLKMDYLMPTGSFKDRGAVMLVTLAKLLSAPRLVADSSGNAGTAIAAYSARAGLSCDVYVPAATSTGKVAQLRALGATVHQIEGSREDTAAAAADAADRPDVFYASHVHQPFFLHGTKTYVFELWEQLGGRLPDTLLLPVGNGTLVLGAYLGCLELLGQHLIERLPVIIAVQADGCAPLAQAFNDGRSVPSPVTNQGTLAEGIAIARPARGAQILAAIRATDGAIVTVSDDQIRRAHAGLARSGLSVEPTAAACWAAWEAGLVPAPRDGANHPHTVAPLCGGGRTASPPLTD